MKNIVSKLLLTGLVCSCFASCSNESIEDMGGKKVEDFKGLTQFSAEGPATRTAGKYVANTSVESGHVKFWWTVGDKIWVNTTSGTDFEKNDKDDISAQTETSNFYFTKNLTAESYKVKYTGTVSDNSNEVVFAKKQQQNAPNNADLIGKYGDCGIATATKKSNLKYTFDLSHKAGYLVLTPYSSVHKFDTSVGVRAVYVRANENLTGTYTMDDAGNLTKTAAVDGGKEIVWYYKQDVDGYDKIGKEIEKDFLKIPYASKPDAATNGIIIVLPPGEYTNLSVEYLLVDVLSGCKGYYKKSYKGKVKVEAGKPHNIAEDIKLYEYDKNQYYTWDAAEGQYFWKGNEDKQILIPGDLGYFLTREEGFPDPTSTTDPRAYNRSKGGATTVEGNAANRTAANAMNVNEALWLAQKGEPMWDKTKLFTITYPGEKCHLYNGGVWFKTLKKIATDVSKSVEDLKTAAPNGLDYRTKTVSNDPMSFTNVTKFGRPAKANTNADYMFLPCTGSYNFVHDRGTLSREIPSPFFGQLGGFWTSSSEAGGANKLSNAYTLQFTCTQDDDTKELSDFKVGVLRGIKYEGYPILFDNMGVSGPGKFRIK